MSGALITEAPTTTVATSLSTTESTVSISDEEIQEIAAVTLLSEINPDFGTTYARNPKEAGSLLRDMADFTCDAARASDSAEELSLAMVLAWADFDRGAVELFGSAEGYAKASGIFLAWRCPDEAERLGIL